MFQHVIAFFSSIPFFSSAVFGIAAMVLVGSSWCAVGFIMGAAPKRGIEPSLIQLFGGAVSITLGAMILLTTDAWPTASKEATFWTLLVFGCSGAVNFCMLQTMSKAMQYGPNGLVWGIIQSSLVFPFIVGVVFFDTEINSVRTAGIILLLLALLFFALTKGNRTEQKNHIWKILAFAGMLLAALQQNLATAPSYFEAADGVNSICRTIASAAGTFTAAIIWNLIFANKEYFVKIKNSIKNPGLWYYIAILQLFTLVFSYLLLYPGMNVMASHGMGGICYPMMVGSCIVMFTLAGAVVLKEKISPMQMIAIISCIAGLACICQ